VQSDRKLQRLHGGEWANRLASGVVPAARCVFVLPYLYGSHRGKRRLKGHSGKALFFILLSKVTSITLENMVICIINARRPKGLREE
jgi:hypothetical protein